MPYKSNEVQGQLYTVQVAPEDCTGCTLCVEVCPARDKSTPRHKALEMQPAEPLRAAEATCFEFFEALPDTDRATVRLDVKGSQLLQPLMEFSGACAGCGETPYVKLLTQLFGDRLVIANATGCSSIYGGNLPTTPYTRNKEGRGPAWANSLFEDNAEFGFGIRMGVDVRQREAERLLRLLAPELGDDLVTALLGADQSTEVGIRAQRDRVAALKKALAGKDGQAARLLALADELVRRSVWTVGGDGWAYDIGYGGLDHVLSTDRNVNILVLDTEVYSNTGGQQSKATPLGAAAKFAAAGKSLSKKDLGMLAMSYRSAYVAQVSLGAKDAQVVKALLEAESWPEPSLVIAYSHCIAHGYDLAKGLDQQKRSVDSGMWVTYRYDPRRVEEGLPPLQLDSAPPKLRVEDYMREEARFRITERLDPQRYRQLLVAAQSEAERRYAVYEQLSKVVVPKERVR
jgi:pyruvate-ferredoxin/flavodoxin oxidoreductase